jgi:hypothetical protein
MDVLVTAPLSVATRRSAAPASIEPQPGLIDHRALGALGHVHEQDFRLLAGRE